MIAALEDNEAVDLPTMSAARQEFSRRQLADWDASARGWLLAADKVKIYQHKRLMQIMYSVNTPVNYNSDVYTSGVRAWKKALNTIECLIKGVPQSTSDGSILLGLSAWHLYPDLIVLGSDPVNVHQQDPLVADGGVLTIGLQTEDPDRQEGVFWSLSLAHLRYYGDPLTSSRAACSDASRLSFEDLTLVVLGGVIGQWSRCGEDIFAAADLFIAVWDCMSYAAHGPEVRTKKIDKHSAQRFLICSSNSMRLLANATKTLVESQGIERVTVGTLVKLDQRRRKQFMAPAFTPVFGLASFRRLAALLNDNEARIACLRGVANKLG